MINASVVRELWLQPAVRVDGIRTETQGGIVQITGRVPDLLAAERAAQIAGRVRGVRAVVNDLEVAASPRTDARIRSDIVEQWALDPVTESYQLFLEVREGRARLSGQVASHQERVHAERLAKGIAGVRAVVNDVTLQPVDHRVDREIEADILSRLYWDVRLEDRDVQVEVQGGAVRLSGWVVHAADRAIAGELAWVQGVRKVELNVEVRPTERRRLLTKEERPIRADVEIEAAVLAALRIDPRVPSELTVIASDGVVTLRGVVPTPRARQVAEEDALNTVGVWAVRNELEVRAERISDELLTERVERALRRDAWLSAHPFRVESEKSVVYVYGITGSEPLRHRAVQIIAGLPGVQEVADRIVGPPPDQWAQHAASPARQGFALAQAVRNRLFWSRYVRASLDVQVKGGEVRLRGEVSSWFEGYKAEVAAWQAGADRVIAELEVVGESGG